MKMIAFLLISSLSLSSFADLLSENPGETAYFQEVLKEAYSRIGSYINKGRYRLPPRQSLVLPARESPDEDYSILNMNLTIVPEIGGSIENSRLTVNDQIMIKVTGSQVNSLLFYSRTFSSIVVDSPDTELVYSVEPYYYDEDISIIYISFKHPLEKDRIVRINITTSGPPKCDPSPFLGLITCQYDPLLTYDLSLLHPMRADGKDEAFSFDMTIIVPNNYLSTASGEFVGSVENGDGTKSDLWHNDLAQFVAYGMAEFDRFSSIYEVDVNTRYNISSYVLPQRADVAKGFHDLIGQAMALYSKRFYPYQFPVISFNEIDRSSVAAYATPMAQFIPASLIDRGVENREAISTFAHEVAHQWWGFMVMSSHSEYPWIDEGFAEFSSMEFATRENALARAFMYSVYAFLYFYMINPKDDVPICSDDVFKDDNKYVLLTYYKGALVLAQLLNIMGDDLYRVLSHYVGKNIFQFSDVNRLKKAFKDITGDDHSWYFDRWLYKAGYPLYTLKYDIKTRSNGGSEVDVFISQASSTYQATQRNDLFDMPVDLAFYNEARDEIDRVTERIDKETLEKIYYFDKPVSSVVIDPSVRIYLKRVRSAQKGDINLDMEVDGRDLLLTAYTYGFSWYSYFERENARFLPNVDIDMNGQIDDEDLTIVVENFGNCILSACR